MAKTYTVKKGDTLSAIAKKHSTTVHAIMTANSFIKDKNKISAGWVLTIPGVSRPGTPSPVNPPAKVEKDYSAIGKQVEMCIQKINNLYEFKELEKMLYGN